MREFMQLESHSSSPHSQERSNWGNIQKQKFHKAIETASRYPWLLDFYFRYCNHPSIVGKEIKRLENLYLSDLETEWKNSHGYRLDYPYNHFLTHVKLGVLWGVSGPKGHWQGKETDLVNISAKIFDAMSEFLVESKKE
jgi:hypothetical protein